MNTKRHATCDSQRRPPSTVISAGRGGDEIGARAVLRRLPDADWRLGDRGPGAGWFKGAMKTKMTRACIRGRKQRKTPVNVDKRRYTRRSRIKIMVGRL